MGDGDAPLTGFSGRSETIGIVVWSDVFLHTDAQTGEDIAIVLMNSQGSFDLRMTPAANSQIVALSTLMSSIQIFNLNGVIQDDHLQFLQLSIDFARFVSSSEHNSGSSKPFQDLIFLVRDWNHLDKYDVGREGGKQYIAAVLNEADKKSSESTGVRSQFHEAFESVSGILLPSPSSVVVTGVSTNRQPYDGRWSLMGEQFMHQLKSAIESILKPQNLKMKRVGGRLITCEELSAFIEIYLNILSISANPSAPSTFEAMVENFMKRLVSKQLEIFESSLRAMVNTQDSNFVRDFMDQKKILKEKALTNFDEAKKMGTDSTTQSHRERLSSQIDEAYKGMKKKFTTEHFNSIEMKISAEVKDNTQDAIEAMLLRELLTIDLLNKKLLSIQDEIVDPKIYESVHKALQEALKDSHEKTKEYSRQSVTDKFEKLLREKGYGTQIDHETLGGTLFKGLFSLFTPR